MSFGSTAPRVDYLGTGLVSAYDFNWRIFEAADLKVTRLDTLGNETTLVYPTDFTVPVADINNPDGGTITLVAGALASGATLTIRFGGSTQQPTDIRNQGGLFLEAIEDAIDRAVRYLQHVEDVVNRAPHLRETEVGTALLTTIPSLAMRRNKYWAWNDSGAPIAVDPASASGTSVLATGTTTARLLADRFADWVNLADFQTVGDGITNCDAGLTAAVALAYAQGAILYWPDGTYLSTVNIPHFHSVRHFGKGILKRGSDLFYPDARNGVTNKLYVDLAGSDANDGLSASKPMLTKQAAGNLIYGYPYGDVTWKIEFAAGTYTDLGSFQRAWPTPNRVQFLGVAVGDGVVPTVIFNSPGGVAKIGIYFQNWIRVQLQDIKFTNFRDAGAVSYSGGGNAFIVDSFSDCYTRNVHLYACDYGVYLTGNSRLRYQAGIIDSCAAGAMAIFHSTYTFGYGGSAADITGTTGTAIINNTIVGVQAQENSTGHCDYCYIGNNGTGIFPTVNSRCHATYSTLINNTIAARAQFNSNFYETGCTFKTNGTDIIVESGSRRGSAAHVTEVLSRSALHELSVLTQATSSAAPVTVLTRTFLANELQNRGAYFKLLLAGDVLGNAGTKTVVVTLGATTLGTFTVAAGTSDYSIEVQVWNVTTVSAQEMLVTFTQNGVVPAVTVSTIAVDLTADQALTVTHQVANVADASNIRALDLEVCH